MDRLERIITFWLLYNKQIVIIFAECYDTEMFDKVEGLNDREEMLDHLRFLLRYEKEILEDGVVFSESEFYDELFSTIIMIADDLREE